MTAAGRLALALVGGLLAAGLAAPPGPADAADHGRPSLRVFAGASSQTVQHPPGEAAFASLPFFVTPVGGSLDLRVQRPGYTSPFAISQVVDAGGTATRVPLDTSAVTFDLRGFRDAFTLAVTAPDGVTRRRSVDFCPNGWGGQRIDPDSVDRPTFPEDCWAGLPFTLGTVWGVDEGWATPAMRDPAVRLNRGNGTYTATLRVRPAYRALFGITQADAVATTTVQVRTGKPGDQGKAAGRRTTSGADRRGAAVPVVTDPPEGTLPDLRSLPAFGISVRRQGGRDLLAFAATVWVAGDALLDIEGFRRADEDVMDAWQYFYDGAEPVGRAPVGELAFDRRQGHRHWHLLQFARYRLLDAERGQVTRSRKQSFCILPTDPVDLSLDAAERRPATAGLDSACGAEEALWIRETLPLGWGDTYYQQRAGQAFDITTVPNGRYLVAVEANPTGALLESDTGNNTSLREIRLRGRPGARTVCVPAVAGIDGRC